MVKFFKRGSIFQFFFNLINKVFIMDSQNQALQAKQENQKVQFVAQQVLKAMNEQTNNESNIIIFLNKLYKNNSPSKNKKMKSIRLNRFIQLMEYIFDNFPQKREDIELLFHAVSSTLLNDKNFSDQEDDQLVQAMGKEFSKIIQKISEGEFGFWAIKLLSYLIKGEAIQLQLDSAQFEQKIKQSIYYQSINLDNKQTQKSSFSLISYQMNNDHLLQQIQISNVILRNISIQKIYSKLFKSSDNKNQIIELFYNHLKRLNKFSKSRKQIFIECFLSNQSGKLTIPEAQAILKILQRQIFDRESINDIINRIAHNKLSIQELIEIDFRKIKGIQQVFIQCLIQQTSKMSIEQVISLFLNMKDSHNYFPLYLILKLNKKIPLEYCNLLFEENQLFTVRRSIIFTLSIIENEFTSFNCILNGFEKWSKNQKIRTKKMYQCILKSIHFSLQNISKGTVISTILKWIHKIDLNKQCHLQYLSYNPLKVSTHQQMKSFLNQANTSNLIKLFETLGQFDGMLTPNLSNRKIKQEKKIKQQLSQQDEKQLELQHKYRLDLQSIMNSNPFVEQQILLTIKQLNKLLENCNTNNNTSIQELIKQLPYLNQNLLEVTLMYINNKYDTFYSEEINNNAIDWALKSYKKYQTQLNNQLKIVLEKQKLDKYFKLIKTLIQYSMENQIELQIPNPENQTNIIFNSKIKEIINSASTKNQRMNSNNFNDYFLTQSKWKAYIACQDKNFMKNYKKIIWFKIILIQLKNLIKNMVKAEKTGNRKEIKNIIAENVEDILALKSIHQYFDAQVQDEGKQLLIQIFRNVQPEYDFFQRTQKLASILNIEFYSIYGQLSHLLQNFNADTLNFLSKLIASAKAVNGEQKKKKNKKKNQKDIMSDDCTLCLDTLVKNFNLLFGDSNCMQSYKSLFTILKKLIDTQKINKQKLASHLNQWLKQINCIPCSNFDAWKNKVQSLSKMWKNVTDLLNEKNMIELEIIQKHFNLFTDLLNKLYQNFRSEAEFLDIEQRILLSLCLIYKQLDFSNRIQEQNDMTDFIAKRFQQKNMSRIVLENKFYYCYECKKNACYACSSFLHRNHDKIYVGKNGNCQHQNPKGKKQVLNKNENSLFGGVSAILKKSQDLPEQLLQRITQKLMLQQQLKASQQGDSFGRIRQQQSIKQLLQGRIPKNRYERSQEIKRKIRQKQSALKNELSKQQKQVQYNQNAYTPQAQQFFQYNDPYCKEFKKIHSQFNPIIPKISISQPKINVSALAKVFLRELQNQTFTHEQRDSTQESKDNSQGVQLSQIKQKYLFFKNSNLKAQNRDYYNRNRSNYGQYGYGQNPPNNSQQIKRNILACNKKFLFLPSSLSMISLSMTSIHTKLQKKIESKQYSILEQQKNYYCTQPANLPFEVLEVAFSKSSTYPILAAVGFNQICFYPINADGRYSRQINPQFHRMDNIVKFSWINETKNLFAIAYSNYIRIGGVSPSNSIKTFAKAQIGKQVRDFDGYMNSKMYVLFIVDSDGKLYFIQVDFKDGRNTSFSATDRLITLIDQNGNKLSNDQIYSIKNIDGNRILLSFTNGMVKLFQVSRQTNVWKSISVIDLKKSFKLQSLMVLETIKIVKCDQESILITSIGRKLNVFESTKLRKYVGNLLILKINQNSLNHNLSTTGEIIYTKQENIESYDFTYINSNNLIFTYTNQEGGISFFKHNIETQPEQIVQKISPSLNAASIKQFNKKFISHKLFNKIQEGGMVKNLEFKENKIITNAFNIITKQKNQITFKQQQPSTNFITGLSFVVELPSTVSQYLEQNKQQQSLAKISLKLLSCSYTFNCSTKTRQVQLALDIKQTLQVFSLQNDLKIAFKTQISDQLIKKQKFTQKQLEEFIKIKSINIYGHEVRDISTDEPKSIYHNAYKELVYDWSTYQQYNKESLEQYFLNYYRLDFYNIEMKRLYKLKYDNANQGFGFKMTQINLFLKLELFAQTVSQALVSDGCNSMKQNVQSYLNSIKKYLLTKQYRRKSLQNSALRLCQVVCDIYAKKAQVSVGHPYHRTSLVNFQQFTMLYQKWSHKRTFSTFQRLCNQLSRLIFTQSVDLYLILQVYPQLIIQISTCFNQLISEKTQKNIINSNVRDDQSQNSITRICSKYISIVCQYYQVLKNKSVQNAQEKMLHLLEQVFGKTKNQMSKELVMNPFLYLQSLFTLENFSLVQSSIDLFGIGSSSQINESFFDLNKMIQKSPKKENKDFNIQTSNNQLKQEQQKLINGENDNWEAIQEQKQLDQQQKQMYMQIQEQFDDEEDMMIDQVEILDLQSKKEASLLKDPNIISELQQISSINKDLDQNLTKSLLSKTISPLKKYSVYHYDFSLQLAIALFRKQNYLTPTNVYFYLGLLYNLLKIIEDNFKLKQDKKKIFQFIQTVDKKIQNKQYASLFIVLNFFICPKYIRKNNEISLDQPQSQLSQYFTLFYNEKIERFAQIITLYNPRASATYNPMTKLSDIMRFQPFQMKNQLYNLRFIANIYLSFRLNGNNFSNSTSLNNKEEIQQKIKEEILFKIVKYKIPTLKNVMLFEKWSQYLDRAKILVSFEILRNQANKSVGKQNGIQMLYQCAKETPDKFVEELIEDQSKINFLEEYSLGSNGEEMNENIQKQIFQLLQIYYKS